MSNDPIKVGDTVWVIDNSPSYRKHGLQEPKKFLVASVGRKYFTLKSDNRNARCRKFDKETLKQYIGMNDSWSWAWHVYRHREEWEKERDRAHMDAVIGRFFSQMHWSRSLTNQQKAQIINIIENPELIS